MPEPMPKNLSKTILAVDDSSTMRQMVSFTLEHAGFEVLEAEDGLAALAKLAGRQVQLIITDINMPRMDGLTLIREVRKLPAHRFTPILILTTESAPELKKQGRDSGATGWIVKPFSPEKLVEVVNKVI
jgi:two-component system, chemotaxis family, chemotaxis protein CheY